MEEGSRLGKYPAIDAELVLEPNTVPRVVEFGARWGPKLGNLFA